MTHFIYAVLELIRTAQSTMIERLQNNIEHFEAVQQNCREFYEKTIYLKKEPEIIELGKQTTKNHLKNLEDKGVVQAISK